MAELKVINNSTDIVEYAETVNVSSTQDDKPIVHTGNCPRHCSRYIKTHSTSIGATSLGRNMSTMNCKLHPERRHTLYIQESFGKLSDGKKIGSKNLVGQIQGTC